MDRLVIVGPEIESNRCGIYDKGRFQVHEENMAQSEKRY